MTENHPLTEDRVEVIWNENKAPWVREWEALFHTDKVKSRLIIWAAYDQGVKDAQERTGWTDDQLEGALDKAASKENRIFIHGGTDVVWELIEVDELRAILSALGIDHEPPATHPDPEVHPLIIDNRDGSAWLYDGGKYRAPVSEYPAEVSWRDPEDFTDWSPARIVVADHE